MIALPAICPAAATAPLFCRWQATATSPAILGKQMGGRVPLTAAWTLLPHTGHQFFAAADGVVVKAGWHNSWGNYVKIYHGVVDGNQIYTLYAHCSSLGVSAGQTVTQGQTIAAVGSTRGQHRQPPALRGVCQWRPRRPGGMAVISRTNCCIKTNEAMFFLSVLPYSVTAVARQLFNV